MIHPVEIAIHLLAVRHLSTSLDDRFAIVQWCGRNPNFGSAGHMNNRTSLR